MVVASLSSYVTEFITNPKSVPLMLKILGLNITPLQRPHHVDNPLIHVQQFRIIQRSRIRRAHTVEDILLAPRLIHWKIGRLFELSNRPRSRGTLADEANDLKIQLINLFSPVGDVHPVSS